MSFEETLRQIVREEIREALKSFSTDDRLLTTEQVAEMLGYSVHTVYRLKREKKLKGIDIGENSLRFRKSEVERFIRDRAA